MIYKVLLLLFLLPDYSIASEINILDNATIYLDTQQTDFKDIASKKFEPITAKHINYGFNSEITVWIKFTLNNESNRTKSSVLEINNPLLEHVTLYRNDGVSHHCGLLHVSKEQEHINPSFDIVQPPYSTQTYYLHVSNSTTALQFSVVLNDSKSFHTNDKVKQFFIVLFIGMIAAFLVYALALYLYTKEVSYFYYTLYIATLVFQQLTYVGFLPLYMPAAFNEIDNLLVVPKVGIMIITAAIFARSFLKTHNFSQLDRIYKYFIYGVLLQILFLATPWFYVPEVTILTGLLFIFFNLYAGIYVYQKGNKQARYFIAGWSFLIVGYFFSIIDALGLYSMMYHLPSLVLLCTIFEALFLLIAFTDEFSILQSQKELADRKLMHELEDRNLIVEAQVAERTKALKNLYRELHHRVKNNLQIILSIIRLQADRLENELQSAPFLSLENRIRSIAKTHELLYQDEEVETIDMHDYIESLCYDIQSSLSKNDLVVTLDIDAKMALREAVYIGLIVNELVSNSIKHVLTCKHIDIALHKKNEHDFILHVSDDGEGYEGDIPQSSLGLKLVKTLVDDQLDGTMLYNQARYEIRFSL
ncbi:MAG: 7TM diverse intracellular signaling domain-containing protein [Campylobacterota bacterium]|nr:7TM diverse intracellular signaling domain-containing protein [Campylobacterota bacterium]